MSHPTEHGLVRVLPRLIRLRNTGRVNACMCMLHLLSPQFVSTEESSHHQESMPARPDCLQQAGPWGPLGIAGDHGGPWGIMAGTNPDGYVLP